MIWTQISPALFQHSNDYPHSVSGLIEVQLLGKALITQAVPFPRHSKFQNTIENEATTIPGRRGKQEPSRIPSTQVPQKETETRISVLITTSGFKKTSRGSGGRSKGPHLRTAAILNRKFTLSICFSRSFHPKALKRHSYDREGSSTHVQGSLPGYRRKRHACAKTTPFYGGLRCLVKSCPKLVARLLPE